MSFAPGEKLKLLGYDEGNHAIVLSNELIATRVPGRVGWVVCDMTLFGPGKPGAGGVGMAIDVFTYAAVKVITGKEHVIITKRKSLVEHFVLAFCKVTKIKEKFMIVAFNSMPMHKGLGSTSSLVLSVLNSLNKCTGNPLTADQLRLLLAYNYVEECDHSDKLAYGYETGMTGVGAMTGGLYIISDNAVPVISFPEFGKDMNVFICVPTSQGTTQLEEETVLEAAKIPDGQVAQFKAYKILMELIPAAYANDAIKVGKVINDLSSVGSKQNEVLRFGVNINGIIRDLRASGCEVAGMSSIGPSIVIVTSKSMSHCNEVLAKHKCSVTFATKVASKGTTVFESKLSMISVLGLPGSGKSTICGRLSETGSYTHIAVGNLLKSFCREHPDSHEAKVLNEIIANGEVEDREDITTKLVIEFICKEMLNNNKTRFVLDGFPRTPNQAIRFQQLLGPIERAVFIDCPESTRFDRIAKRLGTRVDDSPAVQEKRKLHDASVEAVVAHIKTTSRIDGSATEQEVYNQFQLHLNSNN